MSEKEKPKVTVKKTKEILTDKKGFIVSLQHLMNKYTIISEKDVGELDALLIPFFELDAGKIVECKFQNKKYKIKRCR